MVPSQSAVCPKGSVPSVYDSSLVRTLRTTETASTKEAEARSHPSRGKRKREGRSPPFVPYIPPDPPPCPPRSFRKASSSRCAARYRTNNTTLPAIAKSATTRKSSEVGEVACRTIGKDISATLTWIFVVFPPPETVMSPAPPRSPAKNEAVRPPGATSIVPIEVLHVKTVP